MIRKEVLPVPIKKLGLENVVSEKVIEWIDGKLKNSDFPTTTESAKANIILFALEGNEDMTHVPDLLAKENCRLVGVSELFSLVAFMPELLKQHILIGPAYLGQWENGALGVHKDSGEICSNLFWTGVGILQYGIRIVAVVK